MNVITAIMLLFFILGCMDNILGNRWKFGEGFHRGISQMGSLLFSIIGIYAIGVTAIRENIEVVVKICEKLPFDASILIGMIIAPDLGALPLSAEIAASGKLAAFSGLLVAGGIGCLISFQLPIMLGVIEKEDMDVMMQGLLYGVSVIPIGLLTGGVMLGLTGEVLFVNLLPVLAVCFLLAMGAWKKPECMKKVLLIMGTLVRGLSVLLSMVVILDLFLDFVQIVPDVLITESIQAAVKVTIIVCGGLTMSECILHFLPGQIQWVSRKIGVNQYSVIGLILSFTSAVAMLPLVKNMDRKGKLANAAFSVMGAYVLGGQMAFAAEMTGSYELFVFIFSKLLAGGIAVLAVIKLGGLKSAHG